MLEDLADIWADVLAVEAVAPHDDFFKLGGDSMAGVIMLAHIEERIGVELQFVALLRCPVLEDFAAAVEAKAEKREKAAGEEGAP